MLLPFWLYDFGYISFTLSASSIEGVSVALFDFYFLVYDVLPDITTVYPSIRGYGRSWVRSIMVLKASLNRIHSDPYEVLITNTLTLHLIVWFVTYPNRDHLIRYVEPTLGCPYSTAAESVLRRHRAALRSPAHRTQRLRKVRRRRGVAWSSHRKKHAESPPVKQNGSDVICLSSAGWYDFWGCCR